MPELWAPFAVRRDGPASKVGYPGRLHAPKRGEVKHSAVGSVAGAFQVLDNHSINSSWHFTVDKGGTVFQHYPLTVNCWHGNDTDSDGAVAANFDLIGIEHEGGPPGNESEPLTDEQVRATVMVSQWAAAQFGFERFGRYPEQAGVWTLAEHNQVGNSPTACPSNRIPWPRILAMLNEPADGWAQPSDEHLLWVLGNLTAAMRRDRDYFLDELAGFQGGDPYVLDWLAHVGGREGTSRK